MDWDSPHLPRSVPIEAYGKGGFRFGGMSHRGSILCLPEGIWPCPVTAPRDINEATFNLIFSSREPVHHVLLGTGRDPWPLPPDLRACFQDRRLKIETMTTGAAVRTYNILLGEGRLIAALLIAVE